MDRNREARRASIVGSNGFNRRRHRTNNLRDSPDEDGGLELQESVRLRDRVKKDRDRERERDRERDRDRERERERERDLRERSSRSKRRRGERLTSNRDDIGADETSEESVNDEEDEEDEETAAAAAGVRSLTPAMGSISNHHHHHGHLSNHHHSHSSSFSQQQHNSNSPSNIVSSNHHLQQRKSFPPSSSSSKVLRAPPVWKAGDEMISVSVPRKARSASTKRSHDWISSSSNNNSGGGVSGGEQNLGHASSSPARQSAAPSVAPPPVAPASPSSSNASMRKKLKPSVNNLGPKLKPPKVSSKPSSSNPEELEIEIAEVLYGLMTQSQVPSSKKEDSREINRLNSDAKSRNSSPISNSTPTNNTILGTNCSPLSAVAPKRKRPRHVPENSSYGVRSSPVSAKPETDQTPKSEISSPNLEKNSGSVAENGSEMGGNLVIAQGKPEEPPPTAPESTKLDSELKTVAEDLKESRDLVAKEEVSSSKEKESPVVRAEESNNGDSPSTATASSAATVPKANSMSAEMENQEEEKFEIDLMAPPPQGRSSPDRETKSALRDSPVDQKPVVSPIIDANLKVVSTKDQDDENSRRGSGKDNSANEEKKGKGAGEEAESQKAMENKGRSVDLHLDLEKSERDGGDGGNSAGIKLQQQSQKQQQQQMPHTDKSGHSASSLPLPMSMASWPGGLPPMGYMAPLQGVVSMEGAASAPGHIQPLFSQPRPKRCATHCHIARNIHCLQHFMKMSPFWPPPAGSASLFGSKPCNLNVIPTGDMHGNVAVRSHSNSLDKAQSIASNPNHTGKEKSAQPATTSDSAQRKQQILIQQALPPVAPSNLLGPAFIFPLNQQQSAVAGRPSGVKSPAAGASVNAASAAATNATSAPTAMSFNYPNMASNNETQYLAILQNNGYPFPIPAPNYRGNPAQAMPLFNGSFYSSQMIHPSQIQHHQPPPVQSSGSSSAQKHMQQGQQQRPPSGGSGGGGGVSASSSMQNFSAQKTPPSQTHNQYAHPSRPRHNEGEMGNEDSPSTTDSRGSRASINIYGQNFAMPIHPQNFALMTPPAALASAAAATNSNHNDKKAHQQQQSGLKNGPESLPPHGFAMSFSTLNGATTGPGIDITSIAQNMAQNHAMFQSSSEAAARQNIQMMVAAQAAQKKNFRISDDGKSGGVDSSTIDDERKSLAGKAQSIAFTRQDLGDGHGPVTSIQANSVIDSSARSLGSRGVNTSRPMTSNPMGANAMNIANAHNIQAQFQQQQMLQLKQQQQQQQLAANRNKVPVTSNGSIYTEHLNSSSSMAAKFPNALSGFPQNLVQSNCNSSPNQSPQWKSAARTPTPQNPSSLSSSTTTTLKNLPSRTQSQMHTQISFGGNQKPSTNSQGQAPPPSTNQNPSSPMMVGSPTTSSISKGASGSPRTTSSASTNNKMSQASSFSAQPVKNLPSNHSQKSPSILGNPHIASSSSTGPKSQVQQQAQQQLPKTMQQAQQLFFSHPYAQSQSHSASMSSTTSGPSGYYMARRRPDQHQQAPGGPVTSAGGLSLCPPVTLGGSTNTNDPATAIAAATGNVKGGGGLPSQGIIHAPPQFSGQSGGTLLPAGFSYVHPVPAAVQVKPAEQKQPAGNDNLHQWQPEKK